MALLDPEQQCLVLRVLYDGPALAGKTTSLRRLGQLFGRAVYSGEEVDGRTLDLDWLDYTSGNFEDLPIRCQIVAVPGQRMLEKRRRLLLKTADVVVFVADSRPDRMADNVRSFALLRDIAAIEPPVGIVVQANHRDAPDAVDVEALRDALGGGPTMALTEAVAPAGDGIRETFVFAVRLALDRVRMQQSGNRLRASRPAIESGAQLVEAVRAVEQGKATSVEGHRPGVVVATSARRRRVAREEWLVRGGRPPLPDASIPSGFVWPPIDGRITLHEASREPPQQARTHDGDWLALTPNWQWGAPFDGLFFDLDQARAAHTRWARWHASATDRLSTPRCVALMQEATDVWRLWQVVRRVTTLRQHLRTLFEHPGAQLSARLLDVVHCRLWAERAWVATGWLDHVDLEAIGHDPEGSPRYCGLAPLPDTSGGGSRAVDEAWIVDDELIPALRSELARVPQRAPEVLEGLQRAARGDQAGLAETIRRSLLAH